MQKKKNKQLPPLVWADIELSSIARNYSCLKRTIGRKGKIMAVVKADAYGHGLIPVSLCLSRLGADYLAVASLDEALSLRETGIKKAILVINTVADNQLQYLIKHDITATISSLRQAKILNGLAAAFNKNIKVHIEIDTGMGRCGIWYKHASKTVKDIVSLGRIDAEGIFTHFPCADSDISFTKKQITNFKNLLEELKAAGIYFKLIHTANSAGIVNFAPDYCNMVRPGLMLYGASWDKKLRKKLKLEPAMSFKTRIVFLKKVSKGRSISYGRTYIAKSPRIIATIAAGYADGYNRLLSERGEVLIRGKRARVIGRVCMDSTMVDVTSIKAAKVGDEVVLFGRKGKHLLAVEEIAYLCKTIPYEIFCSVSKRVRRFYRK
ncbi:MAG: alanine racemase [Candidatus Omnitrophica bacterium]|nr:alanine racemase [Candidatus Omnitrophota bacterium]